MPAETVSYTRHFLSCQEHTLPGFLMEWAKLDATHARTLIELGAVYHNRVRAQADAKVAAGDYIRVHLRPKRYSLTEIDWERVVVEETEDFVVVDKPSGIPVHATLDNALENLCVGLGQRLGVGLYVTHRLDVPTSGLMLFAKTKNFQARFNTLLAAQNVSKRYHALVDAAPPAGELVHYMKPDARSPKVLQEHEETGWHRCHLRVSEVRELEVGFEVGIELFTGRTHQIRAQLAHIGCPIQGDTLYGGTLAPRLQLHCSSLAFESFSGNERYQWVLARPWAH